MKWEYLTVTFPMKAGWVRGEMLDVKGFNDKLNELGQQGWELTFTFSEPIRQELLPVVVAVFKRPMR